jgi:hypothetical protein
MSFLRFLAAAEAFPAFEAFLLRSSGVKLSLSSDTGIRFFSFKGHHLV